MVKPPAPAWEPTMVGISAVAVTAAAAEGFQWDATSWPG